VSEARPRICIPIQVKAEGGMYTFIGNLTRWLDRQNWPYTADLQDDFDLLFVNSWVVAPGVVRREKRSRPRIRVAHRIDGAATDYGSNPASDGVQARVNLLADVTIFQSRYSRYSTREKFRVVAHDGPVIYNPVDIVTFAPDGPRTELPAGRPLVGCASWSVNRGKGTWQIEQLAARHPDVVFVLCGRFDAVGERPNVIRLGHLSRDRIAEAFRSCDVFLNLSENDPCPNVVLEALASGLPVLYRDSGGVPELVGECGLPVDVETFGAALARIHGDRARLASMARKRAVSHFAPDTIFPQYMQALCAAERLPEPSRFAYLRLAGAGYPVMPRLRNPSELAGALGRRGPAILRRLARGDAGHEARRVGWVTYDSFPGRKRRFRDLDSFTGMRVGNVACWINVRQHGIVNELYVPGRRYDVVVFQKMMDACCQAEAEKIQAYGGRVIFDANVNYYESWGDYFVPGTQPTEQQQRDAVRMTTMADWVVADSTYLERVIRGLTSRVQWIPDNVDMTVYRGTRTHRSSNLVRLVWSGIGKKAAHLLLIKDVLGNLSNVELVLVVDAAPACLPELRAVVPCTVVPFSHKRYAATLRDCDIIISPKRLVNGYELAHTEYKIALGMAMGLPAVASPQQSYVEAIGHRGGGFLADGPDEWRNALGRLVADAELRADLGARARQTVVEKYSVPVVARQFLDVIERLVRAG
jgi:glycosyltransferase involved in cell wall biosynthesis